MLPCRPVSIVAPIDITDRRLTSRSMKLEPSSSVATRLPPAEAVPTTRSRWPTVPEARMRCISMDVAISASAMRMSSGPVSTSTGTQNAP